MKISCPECGFSRDVSESRLPIGNLQVTCPRCRCSFTLGGHPASGLAASKQTFTALSDPPVDPRPRPAVLDTGNYAGFWIRVLAWTLDVLLIGLVNLVFSLSSGLISGQGLYFMERTEQLTVAVMTAPLSFLFATVFGYAYLVFFTGYCGQTPGKMAVRIKVVRTNGAEVGFGRAFLREVVGKFCSKIILGVGYLMVAFDPRKQGLHDKIADTCVIKL